MTRTSKTVNYVVGLMSGTSLDGIDAGLVEIKADTNDDIDIKLIHFQSQSFSSEIKEKILNLCIADEARIEDISAMNMLLGELFAEAAEKVIEEAGLSPSDILLISSHGQTIYHQPNPIPIDKRKITSTLQIGDISVIAERTGITTIGDFRTRDMAAGGQGAPLVPYADYMLFRSKEFGRVLVNIGGISNITVLPKNCTEKEVIAYDTGPGNMLIDAFTNWATNGEQPYDKNGLLAAKGKSSNNWLEKLLQHNYFKLPSPKSTGRELFGIQYAEVLWDEAQRLAIDNHDRLATVTELTAKSLTMEINNYIESGIVKEVLVSGGGRYNGTLMKSICSHLPKDVQLMGTEEYGMSAEAKEAITFALLGYQCYNKKTNNFPSATGANHDVIMGKIAW
ncbi:anhydro-N-acetylmuramic acid kinase [Virgibacillus profundi]|nr:anhydro-N-acetylmuramic acid kinase [Virgibacillus profundi]